MGIDFQRPEYTAALPKWQLVDDMADETNLASHLITLNPTDDSNDNKTRNQQYADRASFFGATGFTLSGLVGAAFEDAPSIELPSGMEYLLKNADGSGLGLSQQMQVTMGQALRKNRAGLFVTFPEVDEEVTRADQDALKYIATVHHIDATRIINWSHVRVGAEVKLSLVVFTDAEETVTDYKVVTEDVIRELALEDGVLMDRVWRKPANGGQWVADEARYPKQGNGSAWTEIPFMFVGASDNTAQFGTPPMYSLAMLNRDHWRTSADHRESLWFAGQVQPWASGVDNEAVEQWQAAGVYVGSRQLMCLPEGGQFGFAQSEPNTANRDELDRLSYEMAKIGARFIEPGSANKTAQQDAGERKVQHSILSLASVNVEDAYQQACEWAANYMNISGEISVELSRRFMEPEMNDAKRSYILGLYDRALLSDTDMLPILKRDKLVDGEKTEDDYAEEVAARGGGAVDADA